MILWTNERRPDDTGYDINNRLLHPGDIFYELCSWEAARPSALYLTIEKKYIYINIFIVYILCA